MQSKKYFFFNLENNCFQINESYHLSTKIRISSQLFFPEKAMKPAHSTVTFHTTKKTK